MRSVILFAVCLALVSCAPDPFEQAISAASGVRVASVPPSPDPTAASVPAWDREIADWVAVSADDAEALTQLMSKAHGSNGPYPACIRSYGSVMRFGDGPGAIDIYLCHGCSMYEARSGGEVIDDDTFVSVQPDVEAILAKYLDRVEDLPFDSYEAQLTAKGPVRIALLSQEGDAFVPAHERRVVEWKTLTDDEAASVRKLLREAHTTEQPAPACDPMYGSVIRLSDATNVYLCHQCGMFLALSGDKRIASGQFDVVKDRLEAIMSKHLEGIAGVP